ncbi:DUF7847 domain-containing protein [Halobaculum gomorrense]|uniref:DUF7847 domain-containing protein n=1 Tax=Halobaculum gomorrense TaxID=43928 RepID=A0A1M5JEU4_9EURY|nr:hypothetical protein [Halobaculum gomorrense]SHG39077.1 hypothetical protein SAMN05443636_0074 [Halobaculum gomorrense]
MALQTALRRTPSTLVRNPVLFMPVLVLSLLQVPQLLLQSSAPILASIVSLALSALYLVLVPFVQAGLIGMADEALDGRTSVATFVAAGKANFVSMFVVSLILFGVNIALGAIAFVAGIVGVVSFYSGGAVGTGGPNTALLAVVGLVVLAAVLAYLVVAFLIQFYGQAIVIDGYDAIDSVKRSVGVVRRNLVSVLGYTVLVGVLAGALGAAVGIGSAIATPQFGASAGAPPDPFAVSPPSLGAIAAAALLVVLGTLFGGFFGVLSVSYYRELTR